MDNPEIINATFLTTHGIFDDTCLQAMCSMLPDFVEVEESLDIFRLDDFQPVNNNVAAEAVSTPNQIVATVSDRDAASALASTIANDDYILCFSDDATSPPALKKQKNDHCEKSRVEINGDILIENSLRKINQDAWIFSKNKNALNLNQSPNNTIVPLKLTNKNSDEKTLNENNVTVSNKYPRTRNRKNIRKQVSPKASPKITPNSDNTLAHLYKPKCVKPMIPTSEYLSSGDYDDSRQKSMDENDKTPKAPSTVELAETITYSSPAHETIVVSKTAAH